MEDYWKVAEAFGLSAYLPALPDFFFLPYLLRPHWLFSSTPVLVFVCPSEVCRAALLDLCAEAVPLAERSQRGLHWRNQLVQPHPHGHQLPAGEGRSPKNVTGRCEVRHFRPISPGTRTHC